MVFHKRTKFKPNDRIRLKHRLVSRNGYRLYKGRPGVVVMHYQQGIYQVSFARRDDDPFIDYIHARDMEGM